MRSRTGRISRWLLVGALLAAAGWMRPTATADDIDEILMLEATEQPAEAAAPDANATAEAAADTEIALTPQEPATRDEPAGTVPAEPPLAELAELAAGQTKAADPTQVEPAQPAVPVEPVQTAASGEITSAKAWYEASNRDLQDALAIKGQQLKDAEAQIAYLKDLVQRIWRVNKQEKVNSYYNMGCVYKACRMYRDAEKQFLKALEMDPSDAGVHYNLAILYDDDLRNKARARKHYERFLELAPNDKDAPHAREWLFSAETSAL